MTSATDELRRLLDERGVKWRPIAWNPKRETFYHTSDGVGFCADEYKDGVKIYTDATITPEQAVAATLGRGTCEVEYVSDWMGWHCKACDMLWQGLRDQRPRYCPNCGRKVVE